MKTTNEIMRDRVAERLEALSLTERAASLRATGQPDTIRFIRTRGTVPTTEKLWALAAVLQCSPLWLLGKTNDPTPDDVIKSMIERLSNARTALDIPVIEASSATVPYSIDTQATILPYAQEIDVKQNVANVPPVSNPVVPPHKMDKDIPVYGTALGCEVPMSTDQGEVIIEQTDLNTGEVIDFLRRPAALAGKRKIYGLYVSGSSMEPAFEPGTPIIVDPARSPMIRDYVVAYLRNGAEADDTVSHVLVKRLARRSPTFVEFEQFNPPATFRVEIKDVAAMHRVLPIAEIIGI